MRAVPLMVCVLCLTPSAAFAGGGSEAPQVATFSYDDVSRVIVENAQIYAIEVSGEPGRGMTAEVRSPADSRVGIEHKRSGGTVTIRAFRKSGVRWLDWTRGPHHLVLKVPQAAVLDLETDTGTIRVSGVDGEKRLVTDTGRIELSGSRGDVEARTDTGSHAYTEVVGDITARSGTGGMTLDSVEGRYDLSTDTGSIQGALTIITGDSRFQTDTGSITLELDQSTAGMAFDLRTDTGTISLDDARARGRLVIDQGSPLLAAQTDTGSIRIRGR